MYANISYTYQHFTEVYVTIVRKILIFLLYLAQIFVVLIPIVIRYTFCCLRSVIHTLKVHVTLVVMRVYSLRTTSTSALHLYSTVQVYILDV